MKYYSQDEIDIVKKHYGVIPVHEIKRKYLPHRTNGSIRGKATRLGLTSDITTQKVRYDQPLHNLNEMTFDELWEATFKFQNSSLALRTRFDEVNVYLDVDKPIGIPFIADVHIGAVSTPLEFLRERFSLMVKHDWMYPIGVGDKIDNYLPSKHPQGMFGMLFPPELQKQLVEDLYSQMKGRWIAITQGCHDEFSHETDDFDFTKYMADKLGCVNLGFGGLINLHVGEQLYKIAVRHKYRYNSSLNYTHTCKRLREKEYPDADIVCVAHNHVSAVEHLEHTDKDRLYIRPGSVKTPDRWTRSIGYSDSGSGLPIIMLWPDKRRMLHFFSIEDAVDFYGRT